MIERYLFDSNVLIDFLNGELAIKDWVNRSLKNQVAYYSPITWVELLCYPNITQPEAERIRSFLRCFQSVQLEESVLDIAAEIRRSIRIKLPDAVIAACAINARCTLLTRNVSDFQRIVQLDLINPYEIG